MVDRETAGDSDIATRAYVLVVERGPDSGRRFALLGDVITIGRDPWCAAVLSDPSVSDKHCELTWCEHGLRIRDLSGKGLTFRGVNVRDAVLPLNGWFRVGSNTLRVVPKHSTILCEYEAHDRLTALLGGSARMQKALRIICKLAHGDSPLFLAGEKGTGKRHVAQVIHELGPGSDKPLVRVDCTSSDACQLERDLFGEARAAPGGAFRRAAGGTVFLEDIGELPLALQVRLMAVLEAREATIRATSARSEPQIISASSRNLQPDIASKRFRADLFYRLGPQLWLPPLREHISDVGPLAQRIMRREADRLRKDGMPCEVTSMSPELLRDLEKRAWPGNVRELESVITRAVAQAKTSMIGIDDLICVSTAGAEPRGAHRFLNYAEFEAALLETHERMYFERLLAECGNSLPKALEMSELTAAELQEMLNKYGLRMPGGGVG
jgi:DNA-binding NtrC family response regulator